MLAPNSLAAVADVVSPGAMEEDVERSIEVVSSLIETELRRELSIQEFTAEAPDHYQGNGSQLLPLRNYPIREVTKVVIAGSEDTAWRLLPHQAKSGLLWRAAGWPRSGCPQWRDLIGGLRLDRPDFTIEIAYSAGYYTAGTPGEGGLVDLPPVLREAAALAAAELLQQSGAGDIKSERTPGGWSVQWQDWAGRYRLPVRVLDMIQRFARPLA